MSWGDGAFLHRAAIWTTVVAVLATAGCSSTKSTSASGSFSPSVSTKSKPPASSLSVSDSNDLETRLITAVPEGFIVQPDNVGDTGPSDLAKAARDDGGPNAAQVLAEEGFVRGYQRLWRDSTNDSIIVFVYQFQTDDGARAEFTRKHAELAAHAPADATTFPLDGMPRDLSGGTVGIANGTAVAIADFVTGLFNVRLVCSGKTPAATQAEVNALASDQRSRL